jgi:hypothetical protein
MKSTQMALMLAAALSAGLAFASSETRAAGPMAPGALATSSAISAVTITEPAVVVVRRRAVVRRPVVRRRPVVIVR